MQTVANMFSMFFLSLFSVILGQRQPDIAVVGAGIGGATSVHYLRELFGSDVDIDVYESNHIGGRLSTVKINGHEYESGGSIIHPANQYMVNFTELLGLEKLNGYDEGTLGIFDGTNIVFHGSSNNIIMGLQLLYRYGLDIFRLNSFVKQLLNDFNKIYGHQNEGYSFTTVEGLLSSMSPRFVALLNRSIAEELRIAGFHDRFIDELVRGAMRNNYGQDIDIGAFVGGVSLAGAEPGLWSVRGGNRRVPEELLARSRVKISKRKVFNISLKTSANKLSFGVSSRDVQTEKEMTKFYDIVVVATPLHDALSDIEFRNFPNPLGNFPQHFLHKPTHFIVGSPNASYFGESNSGNISTNLFISNPELKINSMGKHCDVQGNCSQGIYKIFTNDVPLSDNELHQVFSHYDMSKLVTWHGAYPVYNPPNLPAPPFVLHDNLYYVNGIELAASAMEMSAIAGRNVAQLAYDRWRGETGKVDHSELVPNALRKDTQNKEHIEL